MRRFSTSISLGGVITLLLFIFILLPLLAVILNMVLPGLFFGKLQFSGFQLVFEIFERPLWRTSLTNSLTLAAGTACLGTVLGVALAILRTNWSFAAGRLLDVTAWILLIVPSFLIAQGWVLFASRTGLANQWLGWEWVTDLIFQPFGLILVMTFSKFPLAYLAMVAAMEWNVAHYGDAGRLCGANPFTVWRTVHLPLSLPAITAGWTLVFMDTVGDFGLPAALSTVYRFPTLTYSIYSAIYQSPVRFDMAGVLAFYLVLILTLAMWLLYYAMNKMRYDFLTNRAVPLDRKRPKHPLWLNAITGLFLLIALVIPFGSSVAVSFMDKLGDGLVWSNLTLEHYARVLNWEAGSYKILPVLEGLKNSARLGLIAALVSMLIGFAISFVLTFTSYRFKGLIQITSILSLAVPGIVLGIGYIFIWNQRWLEAIGLQLYGTPKLLVMASVAGAIPYAVRMQLGAFSKIPASMLHAASMQGAGTFRKMIDILLPLVHSALIMAMLVSFGSSIYDLAIASLLQPANYPLVPTVVDLAFETANYGYATATTVVCSALLIMTIMISRKCLSFLFHALSL